MAELLTIRGLSIGLAGPQREAAAAQVLVDDISFSLATGRTLGLIGESGAGKSTIGLAALGFFRAGLKPRAGQVLFEGRDLLSLPGAELEALRRTRLAYVAQSAGAAFNPAHTLGQQITENLLRTGTAGRATARRRAEEVVALLGLPEPRRFLDRFPHQVSGGQLQRAMTAMALCQEPRLIVFDEPTTALDVTTQAGVLLAIRDAIAATGVSALYISHDLPVVAQIADEILVLRHGRAVEHGATSDILSRPRADYTRRLVTAGRARPPRGAATARTPVLTAERIGMAYRQGTQVLDGVSLSLAAGETLALVGQSGSGKTTLGRVITGLHPDAEGALTLLGAPLPLALGRRSGEQLRRLQIVQQIPDAALNPRQTVGTVLARPLTLYDRVRGRQAQRRRVEELLQAVELNPALLERTPAALSGGQKQRVCIARALAAEPDVIVCDEPTSALDPLVAEGVLDLLARLQAQTGIALLFITHDIAIVRALAHSVAIMARGRIVRQGPTREALAPPFDAETERLLDAVPEMETGWLTGWRARQVSQPVSQGRAPATPGASSPVREGLVFPG